MGGGGGGFYDVDPEKLRRQVRDSEEKTSDATFEANLSDSLASLLASYNNRDTNEINRRLANIKALIETETEGSIDSLFGGSVAKHTYVDGLSDVDSLLILGKSDLAKAKPFEIIEYLANLIEDNADEGILVSSGRIAVSINYPDGMALQILPALKTEEGLRVPAWNGKGWSDINPEKFQAALTRRNQQSGGKLIPVIKLVKAINSTFPESAQLTGYHIESLAIAAFRNYSEPKTTSKMLPHFFERAKDLVLKPIMDRSGQSIHVDEYLGGENSEDRQKISHVLHRISKRMRNATATQALDQWIALFGDT